MLLLLNEHGDPSVLFPNLSSYNINNQLAKFEKNLSALCRFYFSGMTLARLFLVCALSIVQEGAKKK